MSTVLEKTMKLRDGGKIGFTANTEVFGPLETWDKNWRDQYDAAVFFTEESNQQMDTRLLSPLQKMSARFGVEYWWAKQIFPIHSTLMSGYAEEKGSMVQGTNATSTAYALLFNASEFYEAAKNLVGLKVSYHDIVLGKNNIIFNARHIPQEILTFRSTMMELLIKKGLKPKPLDDILHITIGRLKNVPSKPDRVAFIAALKDFSEEIESNPIKVTIGHVYNNRNMLGIPED